MQTNRPYLGIIALLGCSLILMTAVSWKIEMGLSRDLNSVINANRILKQTLGDVMVTLARKDKEVDQLSTSCALREQTHPNVPGEPFGPKPQPASFIRRGLNGIE